MSFTTVAEADSSLGHITAWTAITDSADKQRRMDTAELWLRSGYVLPADPAGDVLDAIKSAELTAVRYGLVVELFPVTDSGAAAGSVLTKERTKRKVDVIETETERTWAAPESATPTDRLAIAEVDAILLLAGIRARSDAASESWPLVV